MRGDQKYFNVKDKFGHVTGMIRTKDCGYTYLAYHEGQKVSCTSGYEQAAKNVYHKVHGFMPHTLEILKTFAGN